MYGIPIRWDQGNYELLNELGLSSSQQEEVAHQLSNQALFTSVDIVPIFASQAWTI